MFELSLSTLILIVLAAICYASMLTFAARAIYDGRVNTTMDVLLLVLTVLTAPIGVLVIGIHNTLSEED